MEAVLDNSMSRFNPDINNLGRLGLMPTMAKVELALGEKLRVQVKSTGFLLEHVSDSFFLVVHDHISTVIRKNDFPR